MVSGQYRGRFGHALGGARRDAQKRRLEALVHHAGADVGPARGLMLLVQDRGAVLDLAPDHLLEGGAVENSLLLEAVVEELADLEEFVDRRLDLFLSAPFGQRIDDERLRLAGLARL